MAHSPVLKQQYEDFEILCYVLFLRAGVQPTLDPYAEAFLWQAIALTQEGRSLVNDVREYLRDWRVREGWVGVSNFVRYL